VLGIESELERAEGRRLGMLGEVRRQPPRLVAGQQLRCRAPLRVLLSHPGRWEAARNERATFAGRYGCDRIEGFAICGAVALARAVHQKGRCRGKRDRLEG
jgi:hypothetical protein